jgi:hypothetical protein
VRAGCLKPSPDIREPFYYRTSNGSFGAKMFDNERASLSSKVINLNKLSTQTTCMEFLPMKSPARQSRPSNAATPRKRASASKPTPEGVEWHWADQRLDEELRDTFPASDALSGYTKSVRLLIVKVL